MKRRKLHAVKPFPKPPPADSRYWDPEGALVKRILIVVRRSMLWSLDVRWFARTGKHTKGMLLVFPLQYMPPELVKECTMQRAIHLANGDRDLPCSCSWCAWRSIRESVTFSSLEVAVRAAPKEKTHIEIDHSHTCSRCCLRRVIEGERQCVVCKETKPQ